MTHKQQAEQMVNEYRMILMNEDTECGNEILCTIIAIKCALVAVDEILNNFGSRVGDKIHYCNYLTIQYYEEVKTELENYEQ